MNSEKDLRTDVAPSFGANLQKRNQKLSVKHQDFVFCKDRAVQVKDYNHLVFNGRDNITNKGYEVL